MDTPITPRAEQFLRPPRTNDTASVADRLDVLIAETRETNRLLAALVKQGQPKVVNLNVAPAEPARPTPPSAARARSKAAGR